MFFRLTTTTSGTTSFRASPQMIEWGIRTLHEIESPLAVEEIAFTLENLSMIYVRKSAEIEMSSALNHRFGIRIIPWDQVRVSFKDDESDIFTKYELKFDKIQSVGITVSLWRRWALLNHLQKRIQSKNLLYKRHGGDNPNLVHRYIGFSLSSFFEDPMGTAYSNPSSFINHDRLSGQARNICHEYGVKLFKDADRQVGYLGDFVVYNNNC